MSPGKSTKVATATATTIAQAIEEIRAKCGHINRHSLGIKGMPDDLACELDPGHPGNHKAMHMEYVPDDKGDTIISKRPHLLKKVEREWSDMAGTPAKDIMPGVLEKTPEELAKIQMVKDFLGPNPFGSNR